MNSLLQNLIIGAGTLFALFPRSDYDRFVPRGNGAQRVQSYYIRVGKYANKAARELRESAQSKK